MQTYRYNQHSHRRWVIWLTIFLAMIINVSPFPEEYALLKPDWVLLFLIYWAMMLPDRISIGSAFFVGLVVDLLTGSLLGINGVAFTLVVYLVIFYHRALRHLMLWQQGCFIALFSILYVLLVFVSEYLINYNIEFNPIILLSALSNGAAWVVIYVFLQLIRRYLNVH